MFINGDSTAIETSVSTTHVGLTQRTLTKGLTWPCSPSRALDSFPAAKASAPHPRSTAQTFPVQSHQTSTASPVLAATVLAAHSPRSAIPLPIYLLNDDDLLGHVKSDYFHRAPALLKFRSLSLKVFCHVPSRGGLLLLQYLLVGFDLTAQGLGIRPRKSCCSVSTLSRRVVADVMVATCCCNCVLQVSISGCTPSSSALVDAPSLFAFSI